MSLLFFYDRYHQKNGDYTGVISKGNFTYFYTLPYLHEALRLLERNVPDTQPKKFKILDVGCGVGALSLYLGSLGHTVTGIDISKRAIDIATKAQKHTDFDVTFKLIELSQLRESNFDLIICSEVIEHIEDKETFATQLKSKLKPEGILYLSTPSSQNLLTKVGYYKNFDAEVGHLRRYTLKSIAADLETAGFSVIAKRNVEGPLRNILFTSKLGFLIRFIKGPLILLFHFFDELSASLFGASDIQVLATPAPRKLHILQVTPRYHPHVGGVETHVKNVTKELEKQGHHISVITSQLKPSFLYKFKIWEEIKQQRALFEAADIIHVHDVAWWMVPLFFKIRNKLWITFHGWETQWPVRWQAQMQRHFWATLAKGTLHIGDWIREFYWDDPSAVTYGAVSAPASMPQKSWPKKGGKLNVVFLGRLAPDNLVPQYAEALKLLRHQYDVSMSWLGEGPLLDDTSWQNKDDSFLGAVADSAPYLKSTHLVFANSYLAVLEALAAGCMVGVLKSELPLKQRYFETFPLTDSLVIGSDAKELAKELAKEIISNVDDSTDWKERMQRNWSLLKEMNWKRLSDVYLELWNQKTSAALPFPLSVTFLTQTYDLGGAETFNADLLETLHKEGAAVTAYTTHSGYQSELSNRGIVARKWSGMFDVIGDWKGLVKSFIWLPWLVARSVQILRQQEKSSLVLMSGFGEKLFVTHIAHFFKKKVAWIEFSPLSSVWNKFFGLPKLLYFAALKKTEIIITPTEYGKLGLVDGGIPSEKIVVISCGRSEENLKKLTDLNVESERLPKQKMVVCLSRFESGKGQDTLLYAWKEVQAKVKDTVLVLVGGGDQSWKRYLESLVKQLELEDSVLFTGRVADVKPWIEQAELVVFPSRWQLEGFGLVMIEAMAFGKLVIAFNHGPVPEVIEDRKTGLLVDADEQGAVSGLARSIVEGLSSAQLRKEIGDKACDTFEKKFEIALVGTKYAHTLAEVSNGR